jgi:putative oligomerization/nucleic acid binding protein
MGNARMVHLEMEVEPPSGVPYAASFEQALPEAIVSTLAADQRVTVKVAADDPQVLILWNTPHAAGGEDPDSGRPLAPPGAAAGDRIARLEQLQRLRDSGVLSEEEFQGQKSRILASRQSLS